MIRYEMGIVWNGRKKSDCHKFWSSFAHTQRAAKVPIKRYRKHYVFFCIERVWLWIDGNEIYSQKYYVQLL